MARLADLGSSLYKNGRELTDVKLLMGQSDVVFPAHSVVLSHRSPHLSAKLAEARRKHQCRNSHDCDKAKGLCRFTFRLDHPSEVGLDAFNVFLRFLYIGYLDNLPELPTQTVTSFISLCQWYQLDVKMDEGDERGVGLQSPNSYFTGSSKGGESKVAYYQRQEQNLKTQQQTLQRQKNSLDEERRMLENDQREFEARQDRHRFVMEKENPTWQRQQQNQNQMAWKKQFQQQWLQCQVAGTLQQQFSMQQPQQQQQQQPHQQQQQQHQQQQFPVRQRKPQYPIQPTQPVRPQQQSIRPQQQSIRPQQQSIRPQQQSMRPQQQSMRPQQQSMRQQNHQRQLQPGILGSFNQHMKNLSIDVTRDGVGVKAQTRNQIDDQNDARDNGKRNVGAKNEISKQPKPTKSSKLSDTASNDGKSNDVQKQKKTKENDAASAKEIGKTVTGSKNLELRVTNLTPGTLKQALSIKLMKAFNGPCKVSWVSRDSATIWVDYNLARWILSTKPLVTMGHSKTALNFHLVRRFKNWPMKLAGIPSVVTVDDLQKVFLKEEKIVNVEYFPQGPRMRESRTYMHFADKESLRSFVDQLSFMYIDIGAHTLKWEIACGHSILAKAAFDLKRSSNSATSKAKEGEKAATEASSLSATTDEPETASDAAVTDVMDEELAEGAKVAGADASGAEPTSKGAVAKGTNDDLKAKIKTACKQFGAVFIVKITSDTEGVIYFENKSYVQKFLAASEVDIPDFEGFSLIPKRALFFSLTPKRALGEKTGSRLNQRDIKSAGEQGRGNGNRGREENDDGAAEVAIEKEEEEEKKSVNDDDDAAIEDEYDDCSISDVSVSDLSEGDEEDMNLSHDGDDNDDDDDDVELVDGSEECSNEYDEGVENVVDGDDEVEGGGGNGGDGGGDARRVEIRFSQIPKEATRERVKEELEKSLGAKVDIATKSTTKADCVHALVNIDVAKKLMVGPNFPPVSILGKQVKQNLCPQFKKWKIIVSVPGVTNKQDVAPDVQSFLRDNPDILQVTTTYKPDVRVVADFFSREDFLKFLWRYAITPMYLPDTHVTLDWDIPVGERLMKGGFEVLVSRGESENDDGVTPSVEAGAQLPLTTTLGWIHQLTVRAFQLSGPELYYVRFLDPVTAANSDPTDVVLDEVVDPETSLDIPDEPKFVVEGHAFFEKMVSYNRFVKQGTLVLSENGVRVTVRNKVTASPAGSRVKFPGSYPG